MKILTDSFPMRVLLLIFFSLLAMSQLAPIASNTTIPNELDMYNHIAAIIQAASEMTNHHFLLRIAPFQFQGWSYPYFQFYSPTSYLYAAFIYKYITPLNPLAAYKLSLWSALLFGGIYTYRLTHWLTKSYPAAILSGVFFLTTPYLNILIGGLGAFNETIAISLIPFILYYALRYYTNPNSLKYLLLVSVGWYSLITTHIITFIFFTLLFSLLLLFTTFANKKWSHLISAHIAIFLGCAMATWFLMPEFLLSQCFSVAASFESDKVIYSSSPTLANILSPTLNKIINIQQNIATRAHATLGLPILISVGIAIYAIFINSVTIKKNRFDYYLIPLVSVFLIAFFLLWSPINIWQWMPKSFLVIQYTMRMIAQLMWIGTLIFAWAICWLFKDRLDIRHAVLGTLLLFAATNSLLPTLPNSPYSLKQIISAPTLLFNPNAYVIDPALSPSLVSKIDNYQLKTLSKDNNLALDTDFYIPRALLGLAIQPKINMQGYILNKNKKNTYLLESIMDKQVISTLTLQNSGPLSWHIPLSNVLNSNPKILLPIQFKIKNLQKKDDVSDLSVQISKIELTGFLNPKNVMTVEQLTSQCKNLNNELICHLSVSDKIHLIELPMFYYPGLLSITLNGHFIPYQGILTDNKIIVGITPTAGNNVIKAKFIGLSLANIASVISWALWGGIFLVYLSRRFFSRMILLAKSKSRLFS